MGTEIERKFLVKDPHVIRRATALPKQIRQAYLATGPISVRVRVADRAWLTVKGRARGISRPEYEYEIPPDEANEMIDRLAQTAVIEKDRYAIHHGNHAWEVDVFRGPNAPLILAEIELESETTPVELPDWVGAEVSLDMKFTNVYLATHPYGSWR